MTLHSLGRCRRQTLPETPRGPPPSELNWRMAMILCHTMCAYTVSQRYTEDQPPRAYTSHTARDLEVVPHARCAQTGEVRAQHETNCRVRILVAFVFLGKVAGRKVAHSCSSHHAAPTHTSPIGSPPAGCAAGTSLGASGARNRGRMRTVGIDRTSTSRTDGH